MKAFDELVLVNYCYPDCTPLMNIMRLPEKDAFQLAQKFAESHPDTTAFYRFADFNNYYALRKKQDEYLYSRFIELSGSPEEKHPLSFVVESSDYLREWFGNGIETKLLLKDIEPCHISFTVGDSGADFQKNGSVDLLTKDDLYQSIKRYGGDFEAFMKATGRHYIEAQLWSDKYINLQEGKMIIRKAAMQDAFLISKISCEDLGYDCDSELVSKRLTNLDNKREVVFVAEIDNTVVGYIHAKIYNLLYFESMVNILGIAVSSGYRGKGVGKSLLKHTEDWARELGINRIRLNSGISRKEAHAFYRAIGFDSEKEQICFNKEV